jgi:PPOX class probable F420-dependent enzyme
MKLSPDTRRRIAEDRVVWLTTTTRSGAPAPNPVWFVADGDDLIVFSDPSSRKVANIERSPVVTAHFNCDRDGGDVVILTGRAELTHGQIPSRFPGYLDKYHDDIVGPLETTVEDIDRTYDTLIRIRPSGERLTPPSS